MRAITVLAVAGAVLGVSGDCVSLGGSWYDSASDDVMAVTENSCVLMSKYGEVSVAGREIVPTRGLWKALGVTGELDALRTSIKWSNGVRWSKTGNSDASLENRVALLERTVAELASQLAKVAACANCAAAGTPTPPTAAPLVPAPSTTSNATSSSVPSSPLLDNITLIITDLQAQVTNLTAEVAKGGTPGKNGYCTVRPNVTQVYIPVTRYIYRRWGTPNKCTLAGPANRAQSTNSTVTMLSVGTPDTNCRWTSYQSLEPVYAYVGDTLVFWRGGDTDYTVYQFATKAAYDECNFDRATLLAGLIDFQGLEKAGKNFSITLNKAGEWYFGSDKSGEAGVARSSYCWEPTVQPYGLAAGQTLGWGRGARARVVVLDPVEEVLAECPLYDPTAYGVTTTTDAADSESVEKLKGAVAAMGRQLISVEHRTAERVREQGQSGLTLVRAWNQGTDAYYGATYAQGGAANMHNHANTHHTIGLGEFGAVLNGVQFTTRHNDYSLVEPDDTLTPAQYTSSWPPKAKDIVQPDVPPSVLNAGSVNEQAREMREYFRAFQTQNATHRDYKPYFRPVLCYLEGAWVEASSSVAEPFASERHHIDADSWTELNEKTYFLFNNGQKNNDENLPFLPTAFRGMGEDDTFAPIMAQWFYRITCKKLKEDLPTSRFRVRNDLHLQMAAYHPVTLEGLGDTARAVFDIDPTLEANYKAGNPFPKGATSWEFLDDLMYEIPGFDGPNSNLSDESFGPTCAKYQTGELLNTARYTRYYSLTQKDAMGTTQKKRSFNDLLFAAQTNHNKVSPQSVCAVLADAILAAGDARDRERTTLCGAIKTEDSCRANTAWTDDEVDAGASGAKCAWVSSKCVYQKCWKQRWSYAVPLEVVYLTPLVNWNPYNITYYEYGSAGYATVTQDADGTSSKPYKGTRQDTFYRTPASFFGDLANPDSADTSGSTTYVLDKDGKPQAVRASGHWIQFPEMDGVEQVRQRWPVFPIHEHGSTIWKELKAMGDLIMGRDSEYIKPIIDEGRDNVFGLELELRDAADGHTHQIHVTPSELTALKSRTRTSLSKVSTTASNHAHYVNLLYNSTAAKGEEWSVYWCTQSKEAVSCPAKAGTCTDATASPYCCRDKCPDGHTRVRPLR